MKSRNCLGSALLLHSSSFTVKSQLHFHLSVNPNHVFETCPKTPCQHSLRDSSWEVQPSGIPTCTLANSLLSRNPRKADLGIKAMLIFRTDNTMILLYWQRVWREKRASHFALEAEMVECYCTLEFWLFLRRSQQIMVCGSFVWIKILRKFPKKVNCVTIVKWHSCDRNELTA